MTILYEDNHIIAVNKAAGEIVQGDKTGDTPLSDIVKAYIKDKYNKPGEVYLGVPHRLDRPTSGVVLFARTSKALTRLNDMLKEKSQGSERQNRMASASEGQVVEQPTIRKTYWAIVQGEPKLSSGELQHWLVRNEAQNKSYVSAKGEGRGGAAKLAILKYRTLVKGEHYSLLEVELLTGRHHQIRCQLAAIGCPIKGDLKYGAKRSNPDGSISLHAREVKLLHPVRKEWLTITAPVPAGSLFEKMCAAHPERFE